MSSLDSAASRALPRGPHALSRDEVAQAQRERLLRAMVECVAARGYGPTTVADVLAHSRVSRATFYQLFRDKEACFVAAHEAGATQLRAALLESLLTAAGSGGDARQRLALLLRTYLATLAAEPAGARCFLVEAQAAGPLVQAQRQQGIDTFIDLVASLLGASAAPPAQRFAIEVFVLGLIGLATQRVAAGETARLPELEAPLLDLAARLITTEGVLRAPA